MAKSKNDKSQVKEENLELKQGNYLNLENHQIRIKNININ